MNRWVCAMLLAAMTLAGGARAQIEIHPLPDAAPATPVPLGGHALTAADAGAWIDARLASALRDHAITGAAVAIVVDGEAKVLKGYGRDGDGHPIDGQATRFALGNASATFTWTALMQLAAAGKVDLDADVGRYLGTSSSPRGGRPPTLRQLMTHTAEFTDTGNAQPADAACVMRPAVSDVAPSWSRCDAALAARVVVHVSGMDLATYVARWVFEPIGMPGAAFGNPAGDATATAPAMGNYLAALLPGNRPIDAAALPPAEARQMLDASVPLAPGVPGMALGWRRFDRNGWQAVGLASPTPAGSVLLALVPDSRAGLFIALDGRGAGALGTSLFDGFMGRYFPPRPSVAPARPATAVADAARLAGSYQSSRAVAGGFRAIAGLFGQARITAAGGEIITRDLAGMTGVHRWRETVPSRWQGVDGHGYLGVAVHDGRVQHVAVRSLAPPEVWRPVPRWASARWNLPLLWATLALLAVLTLAWPLVAWRGPRDAAWRWLQGAHAAALVQLGCAVGWAWVARLPDAPALAVRGVQVLGVAALAGVVVAAAGTWQAWRRPCRAWWRLDSGLLLAGGLAGAWFILAFGLLAH